MVCGTNAKEYPSIGIFKNNSMSFSEALRKSRLVVTTYNATSMLESLILDVPTKLF